ncbi:hypothetical protein SGPA1_21057 [Streptomyces misionensis JCM 4497]
MNADGDGGTGHRACEEAELRAAHDPCALPPSGSAAPGPGEADKGKDQFRLCVNTHRSRRPGECRFSAISRSPPRHAKFGCRTSGPRSLSTDSHRANPTGVA